MPTTAPAAGRDARSPRRRARSATGRSCGRCACRSAVARQIDRQHRTAQGDDDAVPRVRVLPAAVEEHELGIGSAPADDAQCLTRFQRATCAAACVAQARRRPSRPRSRRRRELVIRFGVVEGRRELDHVEAIFCSMPWRGAERTRTRLGSTEEDHQQHIHAGVEVHPQEVDRLLVGVLEHEHQRQNGDDHADDHLRRRSTRSSVRGGSFIIDSDCIRGPGAAGLSPRMEGARGQCP